MRPDRDGPATRIPRLHLCQPLPATVRVAARASSPGRKAGTRVRPSQRSVASGSLSSEHPDLARCLHRDANCPSMPRPSTCSPVISYSTRGSRTGTGTTTTGQCSGRSRVPKGLFASAVLTITPTAWVSTCDSERSRRLADQQRIIRWCERGRADRFDYDPAQGRPTLVAMAANALRLASPAARAYWPRQLGQVGDDEVRHVLARVPRMSEAARTFAGSVLDVNRRRVLDACA